MHTKSDNIVISCIAGFRSYVAFKQSCYNVHATVAYTALAVKHFYHITLLVYAGRLFPAFSVELLLHENNIA